MKICQKLLQENFKYTNHVFMKPGVPSGWGEEEEAVLVEVIWSLGERKYDENLLQSWSKIISN